MKIFFVIAALLSAPTYAYEEIKLNDLKTLPKYCQDKIDKVATPDDMLWKQTLGEVNWHHFHHYCNGLVFFNRYYVATRESGKRYWLGKAVTSMTYSISRAEPSFILLPEMLVNRGRALLLQKKQSEGISDLYRAIELNRKLPLAYQTLAQYFADTGNKKKAFEIVSEGLSYSPESKALKSRYKELGGKEPYPAPVESALLEAQTRDPHDTSATSSELPAEPKPDVENVTPTEQPVAAPTSPKIGSPKNPYCRFCPD